MMQIEKARAISYGWWRSQFDKHLRDAHDELYGTVGGSFVYIDGRQCYNHLDNVDSLAYTPGTACYEFFEFIGFDEQAFEDMKAAHQQDGAEHIDYVWAPGFTFTLDDFGIAVEWVAAQMAGRHILFQFAPVWAYDPDYFPDYDDRDARTILDQPWDLGGTTPWYDDDVIINDAYYEPMPGEDGVYVRKSDYFVRALDSMKIAEYDDEGTEVILDERLHYPLYMMVRGLLAVSGGNFVTSLNVWKEDEEEVALSPGMVPKTGYGVLQSERMEVDFKPGLVDFINNEFPKYEGDHSQNYYLNPLYGTASAMTWTHWYVNLFWEGREHAIAPTMNPELDAYGMFRQGNDGNWYLDVENFRKSSPDVGSYFLGQFSRVDVDEEERRGGLFGIIAGIIGAVFGFGDLVIQVVLVKLTLDIIALTLSLITGEEFRLIRAKLAAVFMVYGGVKGITTGMGFWGGFSGSVLGTGQMLVLSAKTVAGFKLFSALPSLSDMRAMREEAERLSQEQEALREEAKEEAKKEAMSQTLGDMESHRDQDDFMYSKMFMPLDLLRMDDPFGADGEFAIKFT
jgi:hypothetical protein